MRNLLSNRDIIFEENCETENFTFHWTLEPMNSAIKNTSKGLMENQQRLHGFDAPFSDTQGTLPQACLPLGWMGANLFQNTDWTAKATSPAEGTAPLNFK